MNNENTWTQGKEHYTLESIGGNRGGTAKGGSWGGIAWGEMPDVGEGEKGRKSHCHVCTYATIGTLYATIIPQEAEAGESFEPGKRRLQ